MEAINSQTRGTLELLQMIFCEYDILRQVVHVLPSVESTSKRDTTKLVAKEDRSTREGDASEIGLAITILAYRTRCF